MTGSIDRVHRGPILTTYDDGMRAECSDQVWAGGALASLDQAIQRAGAKTLITRCPASAAAGMTEHEARASAEAIVGYESDSATRFCEVERVWVVPFSFPWALDPAHPAAWRPNDDPALCIEPSSFWVHVHPDGRIDIPMVL